MQGCIDFDREATCWCSHGGWQPVARRDNTEPFRSEKIMSLLGLVILAATAAPDAAIANPLAPGLAGRLECSKPDEQKKTCRSIASYQRVGDGYSNSAIILISPNGPVTMEITAPVTVKGYAYCGVMRAEQRDAARISLPGTCWERSRQSPCGAPSSPPSRR
jgi:hypothetical protein